MDQREKSYGYKVIRKPDPDRPLKMSEYFVLTADLKTAEVCPEVRFHVCDAEYDSLKFMLILILHFRPTLERCSSYNLISLAHLFQWGVINYL